MPAVQADSALVGTQPENTLLSLWGAGGCHVDTLPGKVLWPQEALECSQVHIRSQSCACPGLFNSAQMIRTKEISLSKFPVSLTKCKEALTSFLCMWRGTKIRVRSDGNCTFEQRDFNSEGTGAITMI